MKTNFSFLFFLCLFSFKIEAQNPLYIPPVLSGTNFNLQIQSGSKIFYTGKTTPTFGINGSFLAPTLIFNKNDSIQLNVQNTLNIPTTLHWHGLHVAPQNDGGPHQIINPNSSWNPSFKVRNNAATFWYHPHGEGKTDLQVSKGIAGFILVKDSEEASLNLPRTYGVDDYPILVQSKAFDILQQIAISTDLDTAIFINGTLNPFQNFPAQIVRLRLLNGSSMRSYMIGFSNNQYFKMIATDAGLLDSAISLNRIQLSPGERAEILIDLQGQNGQTFFLKNFGSELQNGIYGSLQVGQGSDTILDYSKNKLNGANYNLLQINVTNQTANAVRTRPTTLQPLNPWNPLWASNLKHLTFDTITTFAGSNPTLSAGQFGINRTVFHMDSVNEISYLNSFEIWTLVNKTLVAHPFHIHHNYFYVLEKNGLPTLPTERGKKDVILVMPQDSVKFIFKLENFANKTIPYMYHCHLLHHEDDGMMGSFLVKDSSEINEVENISTDFNFQIFSNPTHNSWIVESPNFKGNGMLKLVNLEGQTMYSKEILNTTHLNEKINGQFFSAGIYLLQIQNDKQNYFFKLVKN